MKERVVPFNDVTMLQKKILKHTLSSENLSFIEGKCLLITNFIFISTKIYFLSNVFFAVFNFIKNQKTNERKQADHKIIAKGRGGSSSRRRGRPRKSTQK
jgi:hypothetical protein